MHRIDVFQFTGSNAITAADGQPIFEILCQFIEKGHKVSLDFSQVSIIVSQFWSAAVGQLYTRFDADVLNNLVAIENIRAHDRSTLREVLKGAREHYGIA